MKMMRKVESIGFTWQSCIQILINERHCQNLEGWMIKNWIFFILKKIRELEKNKNDRTPTILLFYEKSLAQMLGLFFWETK